MKQGDEEKHFYPDEALNKHFPQCQSFKGTVPCHAYGLFSVCWETEC